MSEFLKFWWDCIVIAWHIGDGIFGAIVEVCLLIGAGLLSFKSAAKKFGWEEKWKKWEDIVMKVAFILFLVSFLVSAIFVAPFLKYKTSLPPITASVPPKPIAKPIADKIIPKQESPPIAVASKPSNSGRERTFETNIPGTGDPEAMVESLARQKIAEKQARDAIDRTNAQAAWTTNVVFYNYAIEALHRVVSEAAKDQGIAKTTDYFRCLESIKDLEVSYPDLAEIRFQQEATIDFKITIFQEDSWRPARFRIDCNAGYLEIDPNGDSITVYLGTEAGVHEQNTVKISEYGKLNNLIDQTVKLLVGSELYAEKKNGTNVSQK